MKNSSVFDRLVSSRNYRQSLASKTNFALILHELLSRQRKLIYTLTTWFFSLAFCHAQNHSQVFFDITGTDQAEYPGDQLVTISGNLTFYGRNDEKPPGAGVRTDFIQPASDIYIMRHGYYHGSETPGLQLRLTDVNGAPNTLLGLGGGGFFEQTIAATHPQGSLASGEYDIIIDEHQNGTFEPYLDLYLGLGAPALVVKVPFDAPAIRNSGISAMKLRAMQQFRVSAMLNQAFKVISDVYEGPISQLVGLLTGGGVEGNQLTLKQLAIREGAVLAHTFFSKWTQQRDPIILGRVASFMSQPFDAAVNVIANSMKRQTGLAADPPDPAFEQPVVLAPKTVYPTRGHDPFPEAIQAFASAIDDEDRLQEALLSALEKYQGAAESRDGRWCLVHARSASHFAALLAEQWEFSADAVMRAKTVVENLPYDLEAIGSAFASIQQDVLREGLPHEVQLALAEVGLPTTDDSFVSANFGIDLSLLVEALETKLTTNAESKEAFLQLAVEMDSIVDEIEADPTIDLGDPTVVLHVPEEPIEAGVPVILSAVGTDVYLEEPLLYEWDLNGDGLFEEAEGAMIETSLYESSWIGVRATNGANRFSVAYDRVAVQPWVDPNQLPIIGGVTPASDVVAVGVGELREFSIEAVDPEGAGVTLNWALEGEIVHTGPIYTFQAPTEPGLRLLTAEVIDSAGAKASRSWMIRVTRPASLSDLSLAMDTSAPTAEVGAEVTWGMTVSNGGPSTAADVVIAQTLGDGVSFVRGSASYGTVVLEEGVVIARLGNVEPGEVVSVWVQTISAQAGTYSTSARVSSTALDSRGDDNVAIAQIRINEPTEGKSDLALEVNVTPSAAVIGSPQTITYEVNNLGPDLAESVVLEIQLPERVEFVSSSPTASIADDGFLSINLGDILNGGQGPVSVVGAPEAIGNGPAYARVTSGLEDPQSSNNEISVLLMAVAEPLPQSDLTVTQDPPTGLVRVGTAATWIVTVTNQGPDAAQNVTLLNRLPAGAEFVSASLAPNSWRGEQIAFSIGTLGHGESRSIEIVLRPEMPGIATNLVSATSDSEDPQGGATVAAEVVVEGASTVADLGTAITVDPVNAEVGEEVNFTVSVENAGPDPAKDVISATTLPEGLELLSATASQGTATVENGVVTTAVPLLEVGEHILITLATRVTEPRFFPVMTEVRSFDRDPAGENNRAVSEDVTASVAIVHNLWDPELEILQTYLAEMGLISKSFYTYELEADTLGGFQLILYDDFSYSLRGSESFVVESLKAAADSGTPLYFIGDDLGYAAIYELAEPYTTLWSHLTHFGPSGNGSAGWMTIIDRDHPVIHGAFGDVADSEYDLDTDTSVAVGLPGEVVLGKFGEYDSLIAYEDPETGRRSVSQNQMVYTRVATELGRNERKKLFKNAVTWLLSEDTSADLAVAQAAPPVVMAGESFRVSLKITNMSPGPASGVVLSDHLPSGISYVSGTSSRGIVSHAGGFLSVAFGALAGGESTQVDLILKADGEGMVDHAVRVASVHQESSPVDNLSTVPISIAPASPSRLKATYLFNDTLAACERDVEPLRVIDSLNAGHFVTEKVDGHVRRVYRADSDAAFSLIPAGLVTPDSYSIEFVFRFEAVTNGLLRLMEVTDFAALSLNAEGHLQIGDGPAGNSIAQVGSFHHVVLTVAPGGSVSVYLNGKAEFVLAEASEFNIEESDLLHFLSSDEAGLDREIALLRVYEGVLSPSRVAAQAAYPFGPSVAMKATEDFSRTSNPNGVWTYGHSTARGTPFGISTDQTGWEDGDVEWWAGTQTGPIILKNVQDYTVTFASIVLPPDLLNLDPSFDGRNAVLRWTAPASGRYRIQGRFQGVDTNPNGTDVAVLKNGSSETILFEGYVMGFEFREHLDIMASLVVGETIDFTVGTGGNSNLYDSTGVDAVVIPLQLIGACSAGTDLEVSVVKDPIAAVIGEPFAVNLTVSNAGSEAAHGVLVTSDLPADFEVLETSGADVGMASSGGPLSLSLGTLSKGETREVSILVKAASEGVFPHSAQVGSGTFDYAPANNTAEGTINVGESVHLIATVRSSVDQASVGEDVKFEIVAANASQAETEAVLRVDLPSDVELVSASGEGILEGNVITFPSVTLAPGATHSQEVILRPAAEGTLRIGVETSAPGDPYARSGSGELSLPVVELAPPADVRVTINALPSEPKVGCPFTVTYTLENMSSTPATNVVYTTIIPASCAFLSANASSGEANLVGRVIEAMFPEIVMGSPQTLMVEMVPLDADPLLLGAVIETAPGSHLRVDVREASPEPSLIAITKVGALVEENTVTLHLIATEATRYVVQFSDDLEHWRTFPESFESSEAVEQWTDMNAVFDGFAHFYRIVTVCEDSE